MTPIRTCIACRKRESKSSLLRAVAHNGRVLLDVEQNLPGRGAYMHGRIGCFTRASKHFSHSLGVQFSPLEIERFLSVAHESVSIKGQS